MHDHVCIYQIIDVDLCCAHHSSLAALCKFEGPWLTSFTPPRIVPSICRHFVVPVVQDIIYEYYLRMESLLRKRPCASGAKGSEYIGTYVPIYSSDPCAILYIFRTSVLSYGLTLTAASPRYPLRPQEAHEHFVFLT